MEIKVQQQKGERQKHQRPTQTPPENLIPFHFYFIHFQILLKISQIRIAFAVSHRLR